MDLVNGLLIVDFATDMIFFGTLSCRQYESLVAKSVTLLANDVGNQSIMYTRWRGEA